MYLAGAGYMIGRTVANRLFIACMAFIAGAVAAKTVPIVGRVAVVVADAVTWVFGG